MYLAILSFKLNSVTLCIFIELLPLKTSKFLIIIVLLSHVSQHFGQHHFTVGSDVSFLKTIYLDTLLTNNNSALLSSVHLL